MLVVMLLAILAIPLSANAKDIVTEQFKVTEAEKQMNQTKSDLDAINEQVELQSRRVSQERARLKELQKKQASAKNRYAKTRANFEKQRKALDKAWNN